jgi:hypothetical protein
MEGKQNDSGRNLNFRALLKIFQDAVIKIKDTRDQDKIQYTLLDIYNSAFALLYLQDPSLLEFQRRCQEETQKNNLETVFGVQKIPSDTQLRDVIDSHSNEPIMESFKHYFYEFQKEKQFEQYRFINKYFLVVLDGSEYFTSESINCKKCLVKKDKEGKKRYHHQILQSTLIHPEKREVIPLAPEFIRNGDGKEKQDCERNAAKRTLKRMKRDHSQLPIIIVGDSLYSNKPFLDELAKSSFSYILAAKSKDHKSLYADIDGLRRGGLLESCIRKEKNREYIYEWTNEVCLNGNPNSPKVNFCQLSIIKNGKCTFKNAWITDIEITEENIFDVVKGGRARWKIENEGFNTLKNHGYHLEHY